MFFTTAVDNATSRCNESCLTREYQVFLSRSKLVQATVASMFQPYYAQRFFDIFNESQEAVSRHDAGMVATLKGLRDTLHNATSILRSLNMEPPRDDSMAKDAKVPFEKTSAPSCYHKIRKRYQYLFEEFEQSDLIDMNCAFGKICNHFYIIFQ